MSQQQLTLEKLVYGGEGLSRGPEGVVLMPYTLAGETIIADVGAQEKGVLRGRLVRVETPSVDRVEPRCPYFTVCGGCHYQHAAYAAQLSAKRTILEETLLRFAKLTDPDAYGGPIDIVSAEPWQYRNRIQLHFEDGCMGYRAARSRRLVEIDHCPVSSPKLNESIGKLGRMVKDPRWPHFLRTLELFTNEESVQLNVVETERPVAKRFFEWCAEEIQPLVMGPLNYAGFQVSKGSFFQVNRFLIDQLVEEVAGRESGATALDLYAGVGLFTLPLARRFQRVIAVESGSGAVRDLEANAGQIEQTVEASKSTVDQFLETFAEPCDLVVADPPRSGLGKLAVKRLIAVSPRRIVMVTCDPATMARDLVPLLGAGYAIERLVMIDLFPHTYHIETVAKLKKI